MDGEPDLLQHLGVEDQPHGATDFSSGAPGQDPPDSDAVVVNGDPPVNFAADSEGLPTQGLDGVALDHISPGGGQAPEDHDWSAMRPSELAIPQANLTIPVVPKGLVGNEGATQEMDLPVSFQAGWLSSSSPVDATHGTTVIAGHVNWADGSWAPMSNLYNAAPGMTVMTTSADGDLQEWTVTSSSTVPQSELSDLFTLTDTSGPRQLILITCEASVNNEGDLVFDKNHVITTVPTTK